MEYEIDNALGRFIIIEPAEVSKIFHVTEVATVFRVKSIGLTCEGFTQENSCGWGLFINDLIIVEPGSVQKTFMGDKDVYYIRDSGIVAKVINV